MALDVILEHERGHRIEQVSDTSNCFFRLAQQLELRETRCFAFIDQFGDTVFNRLQMPPLLSELQALRTVATLPEEKTFIGRVETLARRCQREVHHFLRFVGD